MKVLLFLSFLFCSIQISLGQQAELHINNNSDRQMEIKIIRNSLSGPGSLHSKMTIPPREKDIKYFSSTGSYFLKIKATRPGYKPVFSKGDPFKVYVGSDGYDVLTITYSIQESTLNPLSGETISEGEFEKNY